MSETRFAVLWIPTLFHEPLNPIIDKSPDEDLTIEDIRDKDDAFFESKVKENSLLEENAKKCINIDGVDVSDEEGLFSYSLTTIFNLPHRL